MTMPDRCPFAQWQPLESSQREPAMRAHDIICLHTMAGYLTSTDGLFRSGGWDGTESHFGLGGKWGPDLGGGLDGALYQWQSLRYQADANLDGNPRVISIETADNARSPIEPWTPRQLDTLVRLVDWLCDPATHRDCPTSWTCHREGIPRTLIPDSCPGRRGIAYHRLGIPASSPNRPDGPWLQPGCEAWSGATGKICPSDARIAQTRTVVVPRVAASEEDDMTPAQEELLRNVMTLLRDGTDARDRQPINTKGITKGVDEAFDPERESGSKARTGVRQLVALGVQDALSSGTLGERFASIEARLDAIEDELSEPDADPTT